MKVNAYLNFDGNCEVAFKFYEKHLGGKIEMLSTFEGSPAVSHMPEDWGKKIMHARLSVGDTILMASDGPPGRYERPKGVSISLGVDSATEAERIFKALSDKGIVGMQMAQTFFAQRFGMVTDQFGIPWMVVCENAG